MGKEPELVREVEEFRLDIPRRIARALEPVFSRGVGLSTTLELPMHPPFLESLEGVLESAPFGGSLVLLGDFNGHVGSNSVTWRGVIRKHGPPDLNPSGVLLLDFCAHLRLSITNTLFRHKGVHMWTWHRDALGRRSMIDFVVVSSDLRLHVMDTRVKRGAELSTDHHLVGLLGTESPLRRSFNSHLRESFDHVPGEAEDIESEWTMFRASIVEAADRCCGRRVAEEGVVSALLACGTPVAADRYRQAKRRSATVVTEAKTWAWEELGETMENDFRTASKRFRTTIRRLRKGKQCTVNTMYSGNGMLLTSTRDAVDRWKEYFKDLLNTTNMPSSEEAGPGDLGTSSRISGAEVIEVVKKLLGGRAPGVDDIHPEFLKAVDVVGLSWLTRLCNIAGITLLSLPGKVYSGVLERRVRRRVEPRIQEEQCGFLPGRVTVDQLHTLSRVFEGAWEFAQPVHMCFVDLENPFDCVPRGVLWGVLQEYGMSGPRYGPSSPCTIGVRAWSTLLADLLFANDVVLLASSARDLQRSLDRFAAACETAGMRISTSKSKAMVLNRKKVECLLRFKEEVLPQVVEYEIDRRITADAAPVHCGGTREDPGHVGETMSLDWSGNAWGSPRTSWKKSLGRGKSGPLCLGCCPCDPTPDKR
ncbi:hypothetical protein D4764_05G0011070 [Takifugu flavidus]|uniref:Reverse transcriptase domain-containing protein n=1 Tax=Takifugu flavidus TaxID=433684 RepID=A0A5C6N5S6_9TELE|nr:hypothetical protein D4764_05G0011070 [Takifugu flavidus]